MLLDIHYGDGAGCGDGRCPSTNHWGNLRPRERPQDCSQSRDYTAVGELGWCTQLRDNWRLRRFLFLLVGEGERCLGDLGGSEGTLLQSCEGK